jgi:Mg-chelatase subunit ChlD
MGTFPGLSFTRPEGLLLVLLLPLAIYLTLRGRALMRRSRKRLSLVLRSTIIALLVLAISGLQLVQASDRLSVVFLVDHSDSITTAQQAQQAEYVRSALAAMGLDDAAGVVVFGGDALVDRPVTPDKSPPDMASRPSTGYTNLADAIRLGLAVAPAETARRLVLLSDGKENAGNADWAARLSAANSVPIDVVDLPSRSGPEVWVDYLKAPATVRESERSSLQFSIRSSLDTTATLRLYVDGAPAVTQQVGLVTGANNFAQELPPLAPGFHFYSIQVAVPAGADTRPENNRYSAFSVVLGKPRILIVQKAPGEAEALRSALAPSIYVDLITPDAMPADVKALAGYEAIVLVNVPATSLSGSAMSAVQTLVRDLGKGLIVVGGDESYAAGGYFRTPLEEMLPVDLNLPSKLDIPSIGMVLVIDRSGSMEAAHNVGGTGVSKIELAKEAAYRAVAQLSAKDYVGVVTFDSAANWVVDLQPLGDPAQFKGRIGGITSGGGTNIYAGLAPAVDALTASKAKSKHIVLLTDGQSEGGDYAGLLKKMAANGITISTVAIGTDADTSFLKSMADQGKGRFYYTEDGNTLPEIFAHESHLAARSYLIEHPFTPARTSPSPILDGIGGLPQLLGYIGTSPRPGGQVVLVSDAGDPVLAQWQYGLGRVVAWTSDAKAQWAKDWVGWQNYAKFWSQAVRWSTGSTAGNALQSQVEMDAGTAHVTVDATAPDGAYLNGLTADAVIVAPDLTTTTLKLGQSAAGRYEGRFAASQEGAYLLRVAATGKNFGSSSQTLGFAVPYSPEYRGSETTEDVLPRLASISGGRTLGLADGAAPFQHNLAVVRQQTDLWPLLLILAILLLPFDVGIRRIAFGRRDIERALNAARARAGLLRRPQPVAAGGGTPEMVALFGAKARGRERVAPEPREHQVLPNPQTLSDAGPAGQPRGEARDLQHTGRSGRPRPGARDEVAPAPAVIEAESPGEESLAARLRKAREQR